MATPSKGTKSVASPRRRTSWLNNLRALVQDGSGTVAMMFVFMSIPLCGVIGLAVDMGRIYHVAMHTQGALDSAALAAGRVAQIEKVDMINKASKAASAYFDQAKPTDVVVTNIVFSPNDPQTEFTVTATSWVRTPFLGVLSLVASHDAAKDAPGVCKNFYGCVKVVSKATAQICLNCSDVGGGNADDGTNLEISMMLDLTGSMDGDKIVNLKAAAKDLIDIVVWGDQSKYTSRVALAPFAPAVNVGEYFTKITGKSDQDDNDGSSSKNIHYPSSCFNKAAASRAAARTTPATTTRSTSPSMRRASWSAPAPISSRMRRRRAPQSYLPTWNELTDSMATSCTPAKQDHTPHEGHGSAQEHDRRLPSKRHDGGSAGHGLCLVPAVAELEHRLAGRSAANRVWHS